MNDQLVSNQVAGSDDDKKETVMTVCLFKLESDDPERET